MKPLIKSRCMSFLILWLIPFSVDAQGISSNKFNAYDRAINEILGQLGDKQQQIDSLNNSLLELSKIKDESDNDTKLEQLIADVEAKIKTSQDSIASLSENLEQVRDEFGRIRLENSQLDERLTKIEELFDEEKSLKMIVKRADGSAELFTLSTLQTYRNYLPNDEACEEYGQILENFPARSTNSFFTKNDGGAISICKLEYGVSTWSVSRASAADSAHIISLE